tara:strand:+ start:1050 stop:1265 length:216 start_codon:yes stop_codon:yes gene_type:complete
MENKEKIKRLRAQIANLKEMLKGNNSSEKEEAILGKIKELEMQIQKIIDIGNGDGTGRKPISAMLADPKRK